MEWSYIRACQKQQALNCTRGHSSARRCTSESERDHLCALFIPHRRRCPEATPILQAAQPPYPQSHTKLRGSAPFQQPRGLASMNPMYAQHHDGVEEAPATAALGAAENAQALVHSSEIREEERRPTPPSRSFLVQINGEENQHADSDHTGTSLYMHINQQLHVALTAC
jgi:hypothetical protein